MNHKAVTLIGILIYGIFGFFAAKYIAGSIYFLVNKSAPSNITLDTWNQYWHWYSDDPIQRKRLQMAAGIAGILIYFVPLLIINAIRNRNRSLYGNARFALASEIRKTGLYAEHGVIVGKFNNQFLIFDSQQFILLAAPTRSGKGVAIVLPNLLNFSGSIVVIDIKLENFKLTSAFRKANGQKTFLFNPFAEDGKTHRWNPLNSIRRDRNLRVGDIQAIGQILYPGDDPKDGFWNDHARNLFLGLTLYLIETPELPCTLGELLRQSSGKGQPIKIYLQNIINKRNSSNQILSDECLDALYRFISTSENTMSSIMATFNARLTIFANPIVDIATSASDIDVTMVRKELTSIYIGIQPNRLADASLLIKLFFSELINLNTKELPASNPDLKYPCLLVLDEFTAIGKIGIIAKAVSYMAGYNLRLLSIIQSISQLESVYGEKDARNFVTNHALQILYPPREQKDANEYSEMLGYFTEKSISTGINWPRTWGNNNGSSSENISDQRRALLLPQELKELGQNKEIIILENSKPILCDKAYYYKSGFFINHLKNLSPSLMALDKKNPTKDQLEQAAFVRNELSATIPNLNIDLFKAKTEHRIRPINTNESIDLSKLAIDIDALPTLDNLDNPSQETVTKLVDSFFSQLDWIDENTGEIIDNPIPKTLIKFDEEIPIEPNEITSTKESTQDLIDLSILDH